MLVALASCVAFLTPLAGALAPVYDPEVDTHDRQDSVPLANTFARDRAVSPSPNARTTVNDRVAFVQPSRRADLARHVPRVRRIAAIAFGIAGRCTSAWCLSHLEAWTLIRSRTPTHHPAIAITLPFRLPKVIRGARLAELVFVLGGRPIRTVREIRSGARRLGKENSASASLVPCTRSS